MYSNFEGVIFCAQQLLKDIHDFILKFAFILFSYGMCVVIKEHFDLKTEVN